MKMLEFVSSYPDEKTCKEKYRKVREQEGAVCKNVAIRAITGKKTKTVLNARNAVSELHYEAER